MAKLDLRRGAHVQYQPVHSDIWREGTLVHPNYNGEEWLVKNEFGSFWIPVLRLRPPGDREVGLTKH